ncbi:MAG: alpha/beta hydrolase [Pseudomonadota bacterium]
MLLHVQGEAAYCYTGGKAFDAALPSAVFIHGAQNDHSVWALQSRYFAHHGYNAIALDLPGHGRSAGAAKTGIDAMAAWLLALLDALGAPDALLVGHSMGALVALASARAAPQRVGKLALLGAAYPMKVSDALLAAADADEEAAIDMVNIWSHSSIAQKPSFPGPGFYAMGGARRLKQRIARINPARVMRTDLRACHEYGGGMAAAQSVRCPTLFLCGTRDMMTPPRATTALTMAIAHAKVIRLDCGHELMAEQPDAVLDALFAFAGSGAKN